MRKVIPSKRARGLKVGLAVVLASCGGGGGGPAGGGDVPAVAGNYDATFAVTQATGCQGVIVAGDMTTGTLRVTQSGSSVTLHISELTPQIASNALGTITNDGTFHFDPAGSADVLIDPNPQVEGDEQPANGTIDGAFAGTSINVGFNFTLFTCNVVGTIIGQR